MSQYPFDGGHFRCSVALYCELVRKDNFKEFLKANELVEAELDKVLALNPLTLREFQSCSRFLIRKSRGT